MFSSLWPIFPVSRASCSFLQVPTHTRASAQKLQSVALDCFDSKNSLFVRISKLDVRPLAHEAQSANVELAISRVLVCHLTNN